MIKTNIIKRILCIIAIVTLVSCNFSYAYDIDSFDLRDKIKINMQNQKDTDTCWTFAALGALETNLQLTRKYKCRFI